MNIFVLNEDPHSAARDHCDKHVVKMILETAQMLSTAHHIVYPYGASELLYRATHHNHPCNIWVRENTSNYRWTYELFLGLLSEYTNRYGKLHLSGRLAPLLALPPAFMKLADMTPFAQAVPEDCKQSDAVQAYREYYRKHKRAIAKWNYSQQPEWFNHA